MARDVHFGCIESTGLEAAALLDLEGIKLSLTNEDYRYFSFSGFS